MNNLFSTVPRLNIPRSVFNRPCSIKTTIGVDYLYPVYVDECLPGDTFTISAKLFGRLATPVVPIMDDLYLDMFWFAVPNRLVDKNWKSIMGESTVTDPTQDTFETRNCPIMRIPAAANTVSSLHDYLGLPIGVQVDVLPYFHRAYNLCYNEFFRDENLCPYVKVAGNRPNSEGEESYSDYVLLKRAKPHDYATSALPWPQKGNPVTFSLGDSANVFGSGSEPLLVATNSQGSLVSGSFRAVSDPTMQFNVSKLYGVTGLGSATATSALPTNKQLYFPSKSECELVGRPNVGLYADLSSAMSIGVNDIRQAFATQHFLENSARGGTRYVETLLVHFGVTTPDSHLQRPEYLGGSSVPLNVNAVPQTSATDDVSPQGNLAAYVTGNSDCHFVKTFLEHSVIICLVNIRATVSYQQGIKRMFSRRTKYDFYWPEFANLGEQTVLNKEIMAQGISADNNVFGYQQRYAEYRYNQNMITGRLRSTAPQSLDVWHLAQKFDSLPVLSQQFIEQSTPLSRVIAYSGDIHSTFILDGYFQIKCARPMPVQAIPGLSRL